MSIQTHRGQQPDDRTKADAARQPKNLREKDPVQAARLRQYLYMQGIYGEESTQGALGDIEFAALSGRDFGPTVRVASAGGTGGGQW
jgi:hypothetical protein